MNKCGTFLRASREKQNLSQKEVSAHLGYNTSQFISNWERGLSEPPVPVIKTLAKLYKIDPEALFEVILQAHLEAVEKTLRHKFVQENVKLKENGSKTKR